MPLISPQDLHALLSLLDTSTTEDRDELLTDLLLVPYPTRGTQNA